MSNIYPLKGTVQHYAWGGDSFIPDLLGFESDGQPCAEYWLGAHINAPSVITIDQNQIALDQYIAENPETALGKPINEKFGRLPFLFKVLDVRDMLSIQVHPSKHEAEKGYQAENELGIPLDAPQRNYKDDNHKPEIMVALSDFWLLHGFLPEAKLRATLTETPELSSLLPLFDTEGYYGLYKSVMEQTDEERTRILGPLLDRIIPQFKSGLLDKSSPDYWAAKAALSFRSEAPDQGIYSIYFFNIVFVKPGQAVFQDAGIPHAYLEGQNMELMANSDNVLRGGLTPKHVDVPELLKHVVFKETIPKIMTGSLRSDQLERIFESPAPDFQLSKIEIDADNVYMGHSATVEILMILDGEADVICQGQHMKFKKGDSICATESCKYQIKTHASVVIYKATAPVN